MTRPSPPKRKTPPKRPQPAGHRPTPEDRGPTPIPEAYFDKSSRGYFIKMRDGTYLGVNESQLRARLNWMGFSKEGASGVGSEIDDLIHGQFIEQYVDYAGPLAGFDPGLYTINGKKVLVTSAPIYITPTYGNNQMIQCYILDLLGEKQAAIFHSWMKIARAEFLAKTLRRGQVMVITGERDHGKSFLCDKIVVPALGGRQSSPSQHMDGGTTFNADWFGSEVLNMDDPGSSDEYQKRRKFGDAIKQFVGTSTPRCHGKGKDALNLTPFWRMVVTVNSEYEDIQVLPPMKEAMLDKIIILKTIGCAIPVSTTSSEDFVKFGLDLQAAIPDYLGWLESFEVPEWLIKGDDGTDRAAGRFGMKAYQDPEIMHALRVFSPEEKLLSLIDEEILADSKVPVVMTAREIERALIEVQGAVGDEARRLLRSVGSCGKYLSRLDLAEPGRVQRLERSHGGNHSYRLIPVGCCPPPVTRNTRTGSVLRRPPPKRISAKGVA